MFKLSEELMKFYIEKMTEFGKNFSEKNTIPSVPQVKLFESRIGIEELEEKINRFLLENKKLQINKYELDIKNIKKIDIQYNNGYWFCWIQYTGNVQE